MSTASPASSESLLLTPEDQVARSLIYNVAFDNEMLSESLILQWGRPKDKETYHASLAWRRFAPTDEDIHAYGCRLAEYQNQAREQPERGSEKRRYYCGFKEAFVGDLTITNDRFATVLNHQEENGEKAHVDLALHLKVTGKNSRANARSEAGLVLVAQMSDPAPHICPCDLDDTAHPLARLGFGCLGLEAA